MHRMPIPSPLGELMCTACGGYVTQLSISRGEDIFQGSPDEAEVAQRLADELDSYFRGVRQDFDVPVLPRGTLFQLAVWREMRKIGYSATSTYGEIAKAVGGVRYSRAVGNACRVNPIIILIPCHRVVAAHGIGGFALGEDAKRVLLAAEGIFLA